MFRNTACLLVIIVALFGCKKKESLDNEFKLKHGQTALVNAGSVTIRIKYTDLVEESRCPPGMNCVTAGNARVKLQLDSGTAYSMGMVSPENTFDYLATYRIKLLEVDYDKESNFAKEKHSYVKLVIEEL